ncbi:MAG: dATP/dGTP diphosphohydrolase domain-containing protein [Shewanella sp.]
MDYMQKAFEAAAMSPAKKRKVGAVIQWISLGGNQLWVSGFNYNPSKVECEDESGNTLPEVLHAEVVAIEKAKKELAGGYINKQYTPMLYVTHQPCENCLDKFFQFVRKYWQLPEHCDLRKLVVVANTGMKFDTDKIRYDLIPPIATEALAKVLTYGAKKYKPNNWRSVDPVRYVAAFERHWQAYLQGELIDAESGLPHLAMAMTNLTFLLELGYAPERQQTLQDYLEKFGK